MKKKKCVREKMLRVRFSSADWELLEKKSKEAEKSKYELVRQSIGSVKVSNKSAEKELAVVLNRINANLNMIAKWCNTYKSGAESLQVIAVLECIEREVKRVISRGDF